MKKRFLFFILAALMMGAFVGCKTQDSGAASVTPTSEDGTTEFPSTTSSIKSSMCTDYYVGQGPFTSLVTIIRFYEDETLEWLDITGIEKGIWKYGSMKYGFYDLDGEKMRINISGYEEEMICVVLDDAEGIIIDGKSFQHTDDIKDETRSKFSEAFT